MAAPPLVPCKLQEVLQLPAFGISPAGCSFSNCTLNSEKFICVRDQVGEASQVIIIDTENPSTPVRFPITADSAIMHPTDKILGLRSGAQIQVFHIDEKKKLKEYTMTEPIVFWKWISANSIAIVTETAVYHWSLEGAYPPAKVFNRLPALSGFQIINYRTDSLQKWLVLIGITQRDGRIVGAMQLYSVDKDVSQPLEGHAATFSKVTLPGETTSRLLFSFVVKTPDASKLFILELAQGDEKPKFEKKIVDFLWPRDAVNDFPVAMQSSDKFGILYVITKGGLLYFFDIFSGKTVFMHRITAASVFTSIAHNQSGGILSITSTGQVLLVSVNDGTIIPYICKTLNDIPLAIAIANRNNLPGAEELIYQQFNNLIKSGDYQGAAKMAAESPMLRNAQTINLFKQLPGIAGQPTPLLQYFSVLLEVGKLNQIETLELVRPVLLQGRKELLERWLQEDKLGCSEELGDLVRQVDIRLALAIYHKAEVKNKVVACLAETGQFEALVAYAKKTNFQGDWGFFLQNIASINPPGAVTLATLLLQSEGGPLVDVNLVVECFLRRNMIQETTAILLDVLQHDKPEDGPLQTKVLEINLQHAPHVADAILAKDLFHHYDKSKVASLSEKAGLVQRALENYTDLSDIKRCLHSAHLITNPDFLVNYFANLSIEDTLECMKEMLRANKNANLQICVQIAIKYSSLITPTPLIALFESFKSYDAIFHYLRQIINFNSDPEVHFKYIEAAAKTNNIQEVERIVRESNCYEPLRVKEFLKDAKLSDQIPLIIVCDRFNFVDDLTHYLYKNNHTRYIEVYVQRVNPQQTPAVVGALLDVDCNEDFIKNLLKLVGNSAPAGELVEQVEKRNRLKLLYQWLEDRISEQSVDPAIHNTIAKICIDQQKDAEKFLLTNKYYDSRVVGKYCENRNPQLAYVAYKRGQCDYELVDVTNVNGMFKHQARYLIERQDPALWAHVLREDNTYRRALIDQIIQTALLESKNPEELSSTVKAFMAANLPNELIELLEKVVLESTQFSGNRNLQNLLILTAIKAGSPRVQHYVNRLDNYDGIDIANIAIDSELYDVAYSIFVKFKHHALAINVLIDYMNNLDKAVEHAEKVGEPEVWSRLAKAQLSRGLIEDAINSYIKAEDPQEYVKVIDAAKQKDIYRELNRYLLMCRRKIKEPLLETEITYSFAKINALSELEEFISSPNSADVPQVGDRCFSEGLYEAARILYNNCSNFNRLAITYVKLKQFSNGVDAAKKANNIRTWKEVCFACVENKEFRLAQICGLNIIVQIDELEELIRTYERHGYYEQLLTLLEAGINLERSHVGMFTELAILYSKYRPEKLMDHLKMYYNRLNIPKVIRVCSSNHQWPELTFLYIHYDDYDSAVQTMISHSADAWDHALFKEISIKVTNSELIYRAIEFYLREHPILTNDLLATLINRVDPANVVRIVGDLRQLPLIKDYLLSVQPQNNIAVNVALNNLYIEEEDFKNLRVSIDNHDNINGLDLAMTLETHPLIEFRRIAAYLYKRHNRWKQSIDLSTKDNFWKDAIQTSADSKNITVVEDLLRFFVSNQRKDCFSAMLYVCYDLIRPDLVLELAWRNGMMDFAMPYMIQTMGEYHGRLRSLEDKLSKTEENTNEAAQAAVQQVQVVPVGFGVIPPGLVPPTLHPGGGFGGF